MRRVWCVARNEYLSIVRTKAFIISVVLMPVFMFGAIVVQKVLEDKVDIRDRRFAVVDETGVLFATLERGAAARRTTGKDGRLTKNSTRRRCRNACAGASCSPTS